MDDPREVRQWQYEHGERKLPDAPRAVGNWSLIGMIMRVVRARHDRQRDAAQRMNSEQ